MLFWLFVAVFYKSELSGSLESFIGARSLCPIVSSFKLSGFPRWGFMYYSPAKRRAEIIVL